MFKELNNITVLKFYFIFIVQYLSICYSFLTCVYSYKYILYFIADGLIPDGS